jgi:hypothetical protein
VPRRAHEILGVTQPEVSAALRGSPSKRSQLRRPKRNAAAVLSNGGTTNDVDALTRALDHPEPNVREYAARAPCRLPDGRDAPSRRCWWCFRTPGRALT